MTGQAVGAASRLLYILVVATGCATNDLSHKSQSDPRIQGCIALP
jgi:hypothetical protein